MKISFVIGLRDREDKRVLNCVLSLLQQTYEPVEIIVLSYGGRRYDFLETISKKLKYVYFKTNKVWSRSRALNLGIKEATGDIIITTDIDLVFSPNVAQEVFKLMNHKHDRNRYLYANFVMMEEEMWDEQVIFGNHLDEFKTDRNLFTMIGTGGFQCMNRDMWYECGGFKELYKGWGVEDIDLYQRIQKLASDVRLLKDVTIVHQWHSPEHSKEIKKAIEQNNNYIVGRGKGDLK